jgi:hypothetical protein
MENKQKLPENIQAHVQEIVQRFIYIWGRRVGLGFELRGFELASGYFGDGVLGTICLGWP